MRHWILTFVIEWKFWLSWFRETSYCFVVVIFVSLCIFCHVLLSLFSRFITLVFVFVFRTTSDILNVVLVGTNHLRCSRHCEMSKIFNEANLDNDGAEESEPDDVEDEEEGHEEVEDVVDGEHLHQLQRRQGIISWHTLSVRQWCHQECPTDCK